MMQTLLNDIEVRVLGSLIEKECTTPEYYPLTLHALTAACNQKNNRDPVVLFQETTVARALESLREKKLVFQVTGDGMRVPKYKQALTDALSLPRQELAVMSVLMLRGPQTPGEIRGRSGPLHHFEQLQDVQTVIDRLSEGSGDKPLIAKLPRQAGQKEIRFMHLLCGQPTADMLEQLLRPEPATIVVRGENERIAALESSIASLTATVGELQKQLAEFRKQFE